jgi:hypothetical protein
MKTKIYVASKMFYAQLWRGQRELGYNIISTWIDEAGVGQTKDFGDLAVRCIREASEADVLIVFGLKDEVLKGALAEVGAALAFGRKVLITKIGTEEAYNSSISSSTIITNHPNVRFMKSLEEAFNYIKKKEEEDESRAKEGSHVDS